MRALDFIKRFIVGLDSYYRVGYSQTLKKESKSIDDFFMLITFSEMMGIENPYSIYTLELLPELMPKFHDWHKKVGLKKSPFENFPCSCCC